MSTFEVKVVRIDEVTDHPNADRLSLNRIGGFIAVSNKDDSGHRYKAGQLVAYVPEGAVVPLDLLDAMGYTDDDGNGILAGSKGNRIKAIKLRGVVSQGLIFPFEENQEGTHINFTPHAESGTTAWATAHEGADISQALGIIKYEPEIPASMGGEVEYQPALTLKFDIENQQKYPDVFQDNDYVYATEKLHGTFAAFVFISAAFAEKNSVDTTNLIPVPGVGFATAFSKGLGEKGLTFKANEENRQRNVYLRTLMNVVSNEKLLGDIRDNMNYLNDRIILLGEIYGKGIQDLTYSLDTPAFAMFGIVGGTQYLPAGALFDPELQPAAVLQSIVPTVPLVYQGTYKQLVDNIEAYRDGKSLIDGMTLREGIVVTPQFESRDDQIGRKVLKLISPDYLTRKNGTEYN